MLHWRQLDYFLFKKDIRGMVKHLQVAKQEVKLPTHDMKAHDDLDGSERSVACTLDVIYIFHLVCFLFVGCFVDPLAPHPWHLHAW